MGKLPDSYTLSIITISNPQHVRARGVIVVV